MKKLIIAKFDSIIKTAILSKKKKNTF